MTPLIVCFTKTKTNWLHLEDGQVRQLRECFVKKIKVAKKQDLADKEECRDQ